MNDHFIFEPERRSGLIFHAALIFMVTAAGVLGLGFASRLPVGPAFLFSLLAALAAIVTIPFLVYRAYALTKAHYILEREGLRLRWGLRAEDVPMNTVLWVRPLEEVHPPLPMPWLRWPGSVLGGRRLPDGQEIEYLAAQTGGLVLLATEKRLYVLSPSNREAFLRTFRRVNELGSFSPIPASSVYPSRLFNEVWSLYPARALLLSGLALSLILLVWVSLAVPGRFEVHLGFRPDGAPGDLVPAARLLLLPVLNSAIYLADLLLGLYFFRHDENHPLAYLLWLNAVFIPILFLVGVYFILRAG